MQFFSKKNQQKNFNLLEESFVEKILFIFIQLSNLKRFTLQDYLPFSICQISNGWRHHYNDTTVNNAQQAFFPGGK